VYGPLPPGHRARVLAAPWFPYTSVRRTGPPGGSDASLIALTHGLPADCSTSPRSRARERRTPGRTHLHRGPARTRRRCVAYVIPPFGHRSTPAGAAAAQQNGNHHPARSPGHPPTANSSTTQRAPRERLPRPGLPPLGRSGGDEEGGPQQAVRPRRTRSVTSLVWHLMCHGVDSCGDRGCPALCWRWRTDSAAARRSTRRREGRRCRARSRWSRCSGAGGTGPR